MTSRTLAEPLSGAEVIEAIVEEVRRKLRLDCYLKPVFAYSSFTADLTIRVALKDAGSSPQVQTLVHVESETPLDEDHFLTETEAHLGEAPPNTVREDSGQGIPTWVENLEGKGEVQRQIFKKAPAPSRSPSPKGDDAA